MAISLPTNANLTLKSESIEFSTPYQVKDCLIIGVFLWDFGGECHMLRVEKIKKVLTKSLHTKHLTFFSKIPQKHTKTKAILNLSRSFKLNDGSCWGRLLDELDSSEL